MNTVVKTKLAVPKLSRSNEKKKKKKLYSPQMNNFVFDLAIMHITQCSVGVPQPYKKILQKSNFVKSK